MTNSAGVAWTAAYIDTIGEPTTDLRSSIAAEMRAKIIYERLISVTDDPGTKDVLGFLMTRESAHPKSFEKACTLFSRTSRKANCQGFQNLPRSITTCLMAMTRRAARGMKDQVGSSSRSQNRQSTAATVFPAFR